MIRRFPRPLPHPAHVEPLDPRGLHLLAVDMLEAALRTSGPPYSTLAIREEATTLWPGLTAAQLQPICRDTHHRLLAQQAG